MTVEFQAVVETARAFVESAGDRPLPYFDSPEASRFGEAIKRYEAISVRELTLPGHSLWQAVRDFADLPTPPNFDDLREAIHVYDGTMAQPSVPVTPIDLGPTLTPQLWAVINDPILGTGPFTVVVTIAQSLCRAAMNEQPVSDIFNDLKSALDIFERQSRPSPSQAAFAEACHTFGRELRANSLFGDDLTPAVHRLVAAVAELTSPASVSPTAPSAPSVDLLGHVCYVWPRRFVVAHDCGLIDYFYAQEFKNGRPIKKPELVYHKLLGQKTKTFEATCDALGTDRGIFIEREAPKPYLYILMRNDLASLNAGKAVAQGSHAANQMVMEAAFQADDPLLVVSGNSNPVLGRMLVEWSREANGFGTCIVLGATEKQMRASVASAKATGLHAGITHDPSYPVRDGDSFYTVPLDTCAYIFDYQAVVKPHVAELSLMP